MPCPTKLKAIPDWQERLRGLVDEIIEENTARVVFPHWLKPQGVCLLP
jgi:hypothetical protein